MMISSFYAGVLGLIFFQITIATIKARKKNQISLGMGENNEIAPFVAAHSNFCSYVPFFLILLFMQESIGIVHSLSLHLLGSLFCIGRFIHFKGLTAKEMNFPKRRVGMHLTLWPFLIISVISIFNFLSIQFT